MRINDPSNSNLILADNTLETIPLKYDLEDAFAKFHAIPNYNCRSNGLVDFARARMQLDVNARPEGIVLQLKISSQQEILEDVRRPGTLVLAEHTAPL